MSSRLAPFAVLLAGVLFAAPGWVHYAPGVGPVESFEEFILHAELIGQCVDTLPVGEPATRASMQMDSQPTPVHRTTWGRLKLVYR